MMNLTLATNSPAPPAAAAVPGAAPAAASKPAAPGALPFAQWLGQGQQAFAAVDDAPAPATDGAGTATGGEGTAAGPTVPAAPDADGQAADAAAAAPEAAQLAAMAAPMMAMAAPMMALALPAAMPFGATMLAARRGDANAPAPALRSGAAAGAAAGAAPLAAAPVAAPAAADGGAVARPAGGGGGALPQPLAMTPEPEPARTAAQPAGATAATAAAAAPAQHDAPADAPVDRSGASLAAWGVAAGPAPAPQASAPASVALAGPPAAWRQSLHEALGERLNLQLSNRAEQAVIRLDPPNLGHVEIAIRHSAGGLEVNISATHGEVLRQLHAVSEGLRNDLAQRQFTEVAVTIAPAPRGAGPAPFGDQQGRSRQGREPEPAAPGLALHDGGAAADSTFSLTGRE